MILSITIFSNIIYSSLACLLNELSECICLDRVMDNSISVLNRVEKFVRIFAISSSSCFVPNNFLADISCLGF